MKTQAVTATDDEGNVYRLIRPEGPHDAQGGFDVALWSRDGVDSSVTVYMQSLNDPKFFHPIPA